MLVLSRKLGETIVINDRIRVTITSIKGDKVRLGITAPPNISVHRQEVHERLCEFAEPELVLATH